ncbi:MAG TPA: phenylalanine--tRNA ligase subunit beta, partial [Candidatus Methanomethylicus sp.]|nr:phenylalanine--tRNA ligase subunit beta [Candidatus Methanomethylicus sp.]
MPTITVNAKDLAAQAGIDAETEQLKELLSSIKCETEGIIGDEISVEVTSDRPDLFSAEGIARAIRFYRGAMPHYTINRFEGPPLRLRVDPSTEAVRPIIVAAAVRGVTISSEATRQLMQLQEKLHNTYGSGRKKASIGIYDMDTVAGEFVYAARIPSKISFVPLECSSAMDGAEILGATPKGKEYAHLLSDKSAYPLLTDRDGKVLSMPPIINSDATKVTERTRDIFIDVTGLDEKAVNICLVIMVTSILERGGSLQQVEVTYRNRNIITPRLETRTHQLTTSAVRAYSGLDMPAGAVASLLERMGYAASKPKDDALEVAVPPYRVDVLHEVDLVEDVVIAYGLDRIEPEFPRLLTVGKPLPGSRLASRVRDLMIGMGFQEVSTYHLASRDVMEAKPMLPKRNLIEIVKPTSLEYTVLRDTLLPKLLQLLGMNTHIDYPQRIFEYGAVVKERGGRPENITHLGAAISDDKLSFEEMQAVVAALFRGLSKEARFSALSSPPFIDGRAAKVYIDGVEVGVVG